jgi:Zn-dependent alcohol dehydrogenase
MKTRAAVASKAGAPLTIETVDLEGPRAGEVLEEIKATGICHTGHDTLSGADPEGLFPAILGHEGAGVVLEVGAGVTSLKPGDHGIPLYTPECRGCKFCPGGKTNLCQLIRGTQGKGLMPDGSSRFSLDGKQILHCMGTSTFANHIVAAAGQEIATRPFQLVTGRKREGSAFGGARGRTDVPKIVDWCMEGKIQIDPLMTPTLQLEDINHGFELMERGESIRSVVMH